ncbi:hypothetical protein [Mesobacillus harenae]|uniref:hypothetical protein n=1 Tax=Mesobacillus harenae TaxID=2213203 RepID=UPI00158041A5|nr:hypothetical protein [Mesobacillus harenae]
MVRENHPEFQENQRRLKYKYLGGAKDNRKEATADPEYNTNENTDKSVGATGRDPS